MFEDVHVELLPARTTMQTVVGAGGPGGNGGAGGNALAIANSGILIIIDHSTVGTLNVTNTDTGPATAAATGGAGGEGGNGGSGVLSNLSLHAVPAVPVDQAVSADPGAHSSPPVPADPPVPAVPVDQAVSADPGAHSSPPVPADPPVPAEHAALGDPTVSDQSISNSSDQSISNSDHDGYGTPGQHSGHGCYGHGHGWRHGGRHQW